MHSSRRSFIKQVTGGVIGSWALTMVPELSNARYIIAGDEKILPEDEHFWGLVRNQFPLTNERIYFNNGTMGPSPFVVREAVKNHIDKIDESGEYGGWDSARGKLAKFVNAEESEISLTHNVTEGINIVAWGVPLKKGDEVILTSHEHAGNALPWLNRGKYDGIIIKTLKPALTAEENLNRINDLITKRTRVIAIPHITCTIGQIFPAKEISRLGHEKGLMVFFDGAHGPGMTMLDLKEIGADFYATCCHKWMCGPKGTGFLFVRKEMLDKLEAKWIGGGSDIGWDMTSDPPEFKGYVNTAHRYDYGTQNAAIYQGLSAATDFLYQIGLENVVNRGKSLSGYLQKELMKIDNVEMLTPTEEQSRGFVTGFRLRNMPYDKFGEHAAKKGFRIRLVAENKLNSIRVSTHIYNNFEEVNKFIEAVKEIS